MPWYFYLFEFVSGLFLANGVPHFVQGNSGHRFQSPFGYPPGVGAGEQHALGICESDGRIYSSQVLRASKFCSWMDPGGSGRIACRDLAFRLFRRGAFAARWEILSKASAASIRSVLREGVLD
jgi:hypothetical protein